MRLLLHRKWLVLGVFVAVSAATFVIASNLPNVYTSETVILVDPQKVPEEYVKSTVTGDVRDRLGTLSQQILSATRLQKIIETLNLYPEERKKMAREDVINKMRADVTVNVVTNFGASQDLQAFRIAYSGQNARLVAQVTNEIASLFIEENLKAREQQATGTNEFLQNQLEESRKSLESQEAKLRDFKLHHVGEMPEQQSTNLQLLGQLEGQLQLEGDALSRAQQQKSYLQSVASQPPPPPDADDSDQNDPTAAQAPAPAGPPSSLVRDRQQLADLLSRYTEDHPDVRKLKKQIADEEARAAAAAAAPVVVAAVPAPALAKKPKRAPVNRVNTVLESQLSALDAEIATRNREVQRLTKAVSAYQAKVEAAPVREQETTQLVRDYEILKAHYSQLLANQLGAETATQLEIRQKGEKFEVLDPGQPAERPSRPNRLFIDAVGSLGGLLLGMLLALGTELLGVSITSPQDIVEAIGLPVLEVIPVIQTQADRLRLKRRKFALSASAIVAVVAAGAILFYRSQS